MFLNDNERDLLLWDRFGNGDTEAFVSIFQTYYTPLFHYGCKMTPQSALIEDCIQELFIELWRTGGKREIESLKAYIFAAFKFKLVKIIKKNNQSANTTTDEDVRFEISKEMLLINEQENKELTQKVYDALQKLPARQREIIYLKFYLGFGYEEVSKMMNINYQAARNLVYKSIKELKKTITIFIVFSTSFLNV
jgi:RNA polymerase sigma-70 factor (ECF subfamily)